MSPSKNNTVMTTTFLRKKLSLIAVFGLLLLAGCAVVEPYPSDAYYYPPYPHYLSSPRGVFVFGHHNRFHHHRHRGRD